MRVLIYSDVHANWEALEAMAAATAGGFDTSLCLGDVIGYGANPNEATAWVRMHTPLVIRGNHDRAGVDPAAFTLGFNANAATAALWTHAALEAELRSWLAQLPAGPADWHGMQLVHGSPFDEDQYVVEAAEAAEVFAATAARLHFFGHTHLQGGFVLLPGAPGDLVSVVPGAGIGPAAAAAEASQTVLQLEPGARYLINPGSVGQPRDHDWRAAFALYDTDQETITFRRVPYDVEGAQAKILAAGLPEGLATRLAYGR